ncbi:MAG: hypothetical protein NTX57_18475 [Armatimonadetes bacterium]|jgi:hypothetical protein|nr:hypothetical protein [Armatimonadota bacterium]
MWPALDDPLNPPLIEVEGGQEALRLAMLGYRVLWIETTPEAQHVARRLMMAQPFLIQNRIEGIVLRPE